MRRVTQGIFPTKIPKVLEFQIIPTGWEKQAEVYKVKKIRPNLDIRPVDRFSTTNSDLATHQHGGWRQKQPKSSSLKSYQLSEPEIKSHIMEKMYAALHMCTCAEKTTSFRQRRLNHSGMGNVIMGLRATLPNHIPACRSEF